MWHCLRCAGEEESVALRSLFDFVSDQFKQSTEPEASIMEAELLFSTSFKVISARWLAESRWLPSQGGRKSAFAQPSFIRNKLQGKCCWPGEIRAERRSRALVSTPGILISSSFPPRSLGIQTTSPLCDLLSPFTHYRKINLIKTAKRFAHWHSWHDIQHINKFNTVLLVLRLEKVGQGLV